MEEDIKVLEEKEKSVLKTFKEGYGLTNAEREILLNFIKNLIKRNKELENDISEMYYKGVVLDILQDELNISRDEAIEILENY